MATVDFAVLVDGEEQGRWVLAVEGDRVLITDSERRFRWVDIASCTLAQIATPDTPRLVVAVQPQQKITLPQMKLHDGRH